MRFLIPLFCFWIITGAHAQDTTLASLVIKEKPRIVPLPFVGYTPSTGFLVGVAPGCNWYMGDRNNTMMSSALGSIVYTQKKQLLFTVRATTFLEEDKWNMITDIRYLITSQPTYGLGTGPQSSKPVGNGFIEFTDEPYVPIPDEQMMEFNYFRFHNTLLQRRGDSRIFTGVGYHLDYHYKINDHLLNLDTTPPTMTSHYAYNFARGFNSDKYTTSGISLNFLLDSRDNSINPYNGRYFFANIRINPQFLGSEKNSSILWLEYRDYIHLNEERPRHLIGFWTYAWSVTTGEVPYMDLPSLGWDQFGRSGRAYQQGRFRGEDVLYGEVEYRVPLQKNKERWGAVVFANATTASNRLAGIDVFDYLNVGYGGGIRFMIDRKARANINIDYAFGQYGSQGFYLGINEVF